MSHLAQRRRRPGRCAWMRDAPHTPVSSYRALQGLQIRAAGEGRNKGRSATLVYAMSLLGGLVVSAAAAPATRLCRGVTSLARASP